MQKLFVRWAMRSFILGIVLLLALNPVVIFAQDATEEPAPVVVEHAPTATETPITAPTATPTEIPVEVTTEVPTEAPPTVDPGLPTETPTVIPTIDVSQPTQVPTEPVMQLLARELFDDGNLDAWLNTGWVLNAGALEATNTNATLQYQSYNGSFYNAAVQASFYFKFNVGTAQIALRSSQAGNYTAALDAAGVVILSRGGVEVSRVQTAPITPAADGSPVWRSLRVSATNDVVRIAVDNVEVIVYADTAPLPPGNIVVSTLFADTITAPANNVIQVDNFFLWVPQTEYTIYPAPTQIPVTETPVVIEPTAEVTAEPTLPVVETPATPEATPDDGQVIIGKDTSLAAPPTEEQLALAQAAPNDAFVAAQAVALSFPYEFPGDTTDATVETNEPNPAATCGVITKTVWFKFTPSTSGSYNFITTPSSTFDTILAVYKGTDIASLNVAANKLGCNDDANGLLTSRLTLALTAGTQYFIQVGGYNGRFGNYTFRVEQNLAVPAVPVLNAPAVSATVADITPDLKWNVAVNATQYVVELGTSATFATAPLFTATPLSGAACVGTVCTVNVNTPLGDGIYYWRVRSVNINGVLSNFSAGRRLDIRTTPPVQNLPAVDAVINTPKPTFTWVAYPGAKYTLEVSQDINFGVGNVRTFTNIATPSFVIPVASPALNQGDWYWRVTAIDSAGLGTATTPNNPPRKFTLNISALPANNAVITAPAATSVTFSWTAVPGATSYTLQYANSADFNTNPVQIPGIATPSRAVPGLAAGTYFWRVQAVGIDAALPPIAPRSFKISPAIPIPTLLTPLASANVSSLTPTLDWGDVAMPAGTTLLRYDVQFATNAAFTLNLVTANAGATSQFTLPALTAGTTYYWRVRTVTDLEVGSNYSVGRAFTVRLTPPTLTLPAAEATISTSKPAFTWAAYPGTGVKYTLHVAPDNGFGGGTRSFPNLTTPSFTIPVAQAPLTQGDWYWKVDVTDSAGGTITTETRHFVLSIGTMPVNNAVVPTTTTANVTFQWGAVPGASGYEVKLSTSNTFAALETETLTPTTPLGLSVTKTGLGADAYYWYVVPTGFAPTELPPASYVRTFFVSAAVPVPVQTTVTGANFVTQTPTLDWNDVTFTGGRTLLRFDVQIATNAAFTLGLQTFQGTATSNFTLPSLPVGVTHYWRVRTVNDLGAPSNYSVGRTFIIRTTPPTLSAPLDNNVQLTARPTMSWVAYPTAPQYRILLRQTNQCVGANPATTFDLNSPTVSLALTPIISAVPLAQGDWYWCVAASDILGNWTAYSAPRKFTVSLLNAPAANAISADTTPLFTWYAVTAALPTNVRYRLEIDKDADFSGGQDVSVNNLTTTSYTLPNPILTLDAQGYGTYYWRVLVSVDGGTTYPTITLPARKLVISPAAPPAPILSLPATGSSFATMPLLDWNAPPPATLGAPFTYNVEIANAPSFAAGTIVQSPTGLTDSQYQVAPALGQGIYYWRVRVFNKFGAQSAAYSLVRNFTIDTVALDTAPTLLLPAENATTTNKQQPFSWKAPLGGAVKYEIRYATNYDAGSYNPNNGLTTVGTVSVTNLAALSFTPPSPLLITTYYWQVRAFDAAGNPSPWSSVRTLKVSSLLTDAPVPYRFGPSDAILLTWAPLSWAALPGGYYELQIDNHATLASPEFQRTDATGNEILSTVYDDNYGFIVPNGELANGTWFWRVRGFNPNTGAYGAWSSIGRFTVEK